MPEIKSDILNEFDIIIADLKALLAKIPAGYEDRHGRGNEAGYISQDNQDPFWVLRTDALKLLNRIDSEDVDLRQTKEYIGKIDPIRFNLERMLDELQKRRSDYESGILTSHPRLPEVPAVKIAEKRKWIDIKKSVKHVIETIFDALVVGIIKRLIP